MFTGVVIISLPELAYMRVQKDSVYLINAKTSKFTTFFLPVYTYRRKKFQNKN